jgi:hypothetical protein
MKPTHTPAIPTDAVMIAVEPAELAGIESRSPEWERARALLEGVYLTARRCLAGQVFLGRELLSLKRDLGFEGGGRRITARAGIKSWGDYTRAELGISDDMADRAIAAYKVIRHRGETALGDDSEEFRLLIAPPCSLAPAEQKKLQKAIGELIRGDDSQRSLLRELRMINAPFKQDGGDTSAAKKPAKQDSPALVASVPFRELFNDLEETEHEISRLRRHSDLDGYLYLLPLVTDDPDKITGLLDYRQSFERVRSEIEAGLGVLSEKIAAAVESKMQGDTPRPARPKKTNTRKK